MTFDEFVAKYKYPNTTPAVQVLDVRSPAEFKDGHLIGAIHIPLQELAERYDELSRDQELIVYCHAGVRSAAAVQILQSAGFEKLAHLQDGIQAVPQQLLNK